MSAPSAPRDPLPPEPTSAPSNGRDAVFGRSLRYEIAGEEGPVILAGPTCDSADILYDKANYQMPHDLKIGDRVRIFSTGAYTTTYSAVNFNGFEPLKAYYI